MVKEELNEVEDDEDGEKCVEMDVERESPLHVVVTREARLDQVFVGHGPEERGHDQAHADAVHEYHIQKEFHKIPKAKIVQISIRSK